MWYRTEDYDRTAVANAIAAAKEIIEEAEEKSAAHMPAVTRETVSGIMASARSMIPILQRHGYVTTRQLWALKNWKKAVREA